MMATGNDGDWVIQPIKSIYLGLFDGPHATPKPAEDGPVFLGIKNLTDDGRIDLSEIRHIAEEEYPLWTRRVTPEAGDIVFTYEATLNRYAIIPEGLRCCLGRRLALVRPNTRRVHTRFLHYYFFSKDWRNLICEKTIAGSTVDRIPLIDFPNFEVKLPHIGTQRKIAAILSSYDDLIENNLRRIKILEEMAQRLYREWFVYFRFPGHEKVRLVDSPLGKIPEGWEVVTLEQVLFSIESGSRPKGGIDPNAKDVPSIGAENILGLGQYDYSKEKYITHEFYENMRKGIVKSGDVLLYKDGAKIGRKSMFQNDFPHKRCCINEHAFILRTNGKCSQAYLYFWLDQADMTSRIISLNSNAAQPGINQKGVKGLPILLADNSPLLRFDGVIEPILTALFNLTKKNRILHQTRDLLLPRLISGELDISDLEIKTAHENEK